MEIDALKKRPNLAQNSKLNRRYLQFEKLLIALNKKDLPDRVVTTINQDIDAINAMSDTDKALGKQLKKTQSNILKLIEKELKLVTKHHYRNTWMALGMTIFGIPIGIAFGISLGNMGFLGIGLPIGMAIGLAVGSAMDKKASENGKQLDLEIKY